MKASLIALAAALVTALPAYAVTLDSSSLNGNLLDDSFSTPSLVSLDLSLLNTSPISLSFIIDADDIAAGGVDFNALVREVSGWGIGSLSLTLGNAQFIQATGAQFTTLNGDLRDAHVQSPWPTTYPLSSLTLGALTLVGDPATEFYLGNPFMDADTSDWRIAFSGLSAGDRFTLDIGLTPAVPEPDDWAMMLAGLGMIVLSAARKLGR